MVIIKHKFIILSFPPRIGVRDKLRRESIFILPNYRAKSRVILNSFLKEGWAITIRGLSRVISPIIPFQFSSPLAGED
jgi:hypothetical protein